MNMSSPHAILTSTHTDITLTQAIHMSAVRTNKLRARMGSHILVYEGEAMHNVQNRLGANAV